MKNLWLFLSAAILAVVFSAFVTEKTSPEELWYFEYGVPQLFEGEPCPAGTDITCEVYIENVGIRALYEDELGMIPYKTDFNR